MPLALSQYLAAVQAATQPPPPQPTQPAFQPNPGAVGYQPNPGLAPVPPEVLGATDYAIDIDQPAPVASPNAIDVDADARMAADQADADGQRYAPPQVGPNAQAPEHPFPLASAGGAGVIPAHEQDLRGPSLKGAQGNYNDAVAGAIDVGTAAHGMGAGREYALALEQERAAHERQMAAEQAMAERQEEMLQKEQDFAQSAKALGQFAFKPDGGFWESRTTGQKIAGMFSLALNGFMAGVGRPVPDLIGQRIEQSIKAQENAYHALKDTANAQQNAFGLAMQKWGNLDAARSHVRVAAIEGLQAQAAQVMALNKGTEIGARAAAAYADLEGQKMQQIQMGIRFLPAQAVGRRFVDQNTGIVYTEQEAKGLAKDWYASAAKRDEIGLNVAGDLMKEGAKAGAKAGEHTVVLPNGEQVAAPSDTESTTLRNLSTASHDVRRLVNRAKEIRSSPTWRASPGDRAEIESIQQQLRTSFSVAAQLGALSKDDIKISDGAVGDLMGIGSGPERQLDSFHAKVENAWRNRVKTYANAPTGAKGEIPKEAGIKWGAK